MAVLRKQPVFREKESEELVNTTNFIESFLQSAQTVEALLFLTECVRLVVYIKATKSSNLKAMRKIQKKLRLKFSCFPVLLLKFFILTQGNFKE